MPLMLDEQEYIKRYPWKAIACAICGTLFLRCKRGTSKQKTCSPACSKILRAQTEKEARKKFNKKHPHYRRGRYNAAVTKERKERAAN